MSSQLLWLLMMPTGGDDQLPLPPVLDPLITLTHFTWTKPRQKRHARQWIFPRVAIQFERTEEGKNIDPLIIVQ